jgi:ferritin-like metal-binding protein YciE
VWTAPFLVRGGAHKNTPGFDATGVSTLAPFGFAKSRGAGSEFPALQTINGGEYFMAMDSLKDLYIEELKDLYNAENQLLKALPRMAKKAASADLKAAFEEHLGQTEGQVNRLEKIFKKLGEKPTGKTCKAMKGLVEEGKEIIDEDGDESVLDAALIGAAQKVEHYEIASYGTARTIASMLGEEDAVELLQKTLDEEGETDKKLTSLAESLVNPEAQTADGNGRSKKKSSGKRK